MKTIAKDVTINVSGIDMTVDLILNDSKNIEIIFSDEDLSKMPDGYSYVGWNNELRIEIFEK